MYGLIYVIVEKKNEIVIDFKLGEISIFFQILCVYLKMYDQIIS